VSTVLRNGVNDSIVKFRRSAQFELPCHMFSGPLFVNVTYLVLGDKWWGAPCN